jgi:hypothetical protein
LSFSSKSPWVLRSNKSSSKDSIQEANCIRDKLLNWPFAI